MDCGWEQQNLILDSLQIARGDIEKWLSSCCDIPEEKSIKLVSIDVFDKIDHLQEFIVKWKASQICVALYSYYSFTSCFASNVQVVSSIFN